MSPAIPGVIGIHHIGVPVPDVAKARAFYIDILGAHEAVAPLEWRETLSSTKSSA